MLTRQINAAVVAIANSAESHVGKLEALNSHREAVAHLGEEIRVAGSSQAVEHAASRPPSHEAGENSPSKSMLERWDIASPTAARVQRDLMLKKQKLSQDLEKAKKDLEKVLKLNRPASSFDVDLQPKQTTQTDDLDTFEKDIQRLRDAIESVDLSSLKEADPHKARLLARWQ